VLLDENEKMPERYAALFGLRNRGSPEAVDAIVASLQCESALLKHEVCITGRYFCVRVCFVSCKLQGVENVFLCRYDLLIFVNPFWFCRWHMF
jgi:hypothetical protein